MLLLLLRPRATGQPATGGLSAASCDSNTPSGQTDDTSVLAAQSDDSATPNAVTCD